jgi:uncharacterized protein YgiM (DUF1202 family)
LLLPTYPEDVFVRTALTTRLLGAALAIGLLIGLLGAPAASAATTQVTATTNVNVRAKPSTSSQVVGGLYRGQTATAVGQVRGWTKIKYASSTVWVASRYLTRGKNLPPPSRVNAGAVKITTTNLNLRSGPGLTYPVIRVLPQGTRATTTGKTARGFVELLVGRSRGWASTQYLTGARTGLPAVVGTRVATAALDIRTSSGDDAATIAEVKKGTRLSVTGATQNGRAQIVYRNAVRWVTAKYLANPKVTAPTPPKLPRVVGTRYATATLVVRSTYRSSSAVITQVVRGTRLRITGVVRSGRRQVVYDNAVRWVSAKYLSKTRPASTSPRTYAVEKGLQPNAVRLHRAARARFPQITTYYGVRPDTIPDHPAGRAIDIMIPKYKTKSGRALGFKVARWAKANARTLHINYVIWDQHIWNIERNGEGWRFMASRGNPTANHKDHVHVTVYNS